MDQGAAGSNKRNGDKRDQIDQEQTDDKIENQITKCQRNWQSRCAMWCNDYNLDHRSWLDYQPWLPTIITNLD